MIKKQLFAASVTAALGLYNLTVQADVYANFPVTVTDYTGHQEHSEAYSGQIARHVLHNSLKQLTTMGSGKANTELKHNMMAYYSGKHNGRTIIDPASQEGFPVLEVAVDQLSIDKNLSDKTYRGLVPGWPGSMTGLEVVKFMIDQASASEGGYDPLNGYDYTQLISKFLMGAVFYHQTVDYYLDEKLAVNIKPNHEPYTDGAPYTGKEHVWDKAFGYFGAPAHALELSAADVYAIAKQQPAALVKADYNGDGLVSLDTEMVYAHAYYAAIFDQTGKTQYLHNIMQAFIDGRQLLTKANGQTLTLMQRSELKGYAAIIKANWEQVIVEAVFKYAGSVYADLQQLQNLIETHSGDIQRSYRRYVKHWGELKGFALALQMGSRDLGEISVQLNRLIGYSPVLLGNTQVVGLAKGQYQQASSISLSEYQMHMIKVQQLMSDQFGIKARSQDVMGDMTALIKQLGDTLSAEND